jgi:hypothetical protein
MNKDKVGETFHYPITFHYQITFILPRGYVKVYFHLPYRQTERITKEHAQGKVSSISDHSTISSRINKSDITIDDYNKSKRFKDDYIIITINSNGIKVTNRGQWMSNKWKARSNDNKRYLKIHSAVDIRRKKIL